MTGAVAITGTGVITPVGSLPARFEALPEPVRVRAVRAERVTQLAFVAAYAALTEAALIATDGPPRPRLGIVLGTAFGCFLTNAAFERRFLEGGPAGASPRLFAATVSNAAAGELSIAYRLGGPCVTLSAGGASGSLALGHAADLLRAGRADAVLAGGIDAIGDDLLGWMGGGGLDAEPPVTEAAAVVVLETLPSARSRGAPILGTVDGCASGFDPRDRGWGSGLAAAIESALAEARVTPSELHCLVSRSSDGHRGIALALGDSAPALTARAVPGETLAAAGPLGLLAAFAEAPPGAPVLVLDVCASDHVAALVARRAGAA